MKCHPPVSLEWRSLVFPTFDRREAKSRVSSPLISAPQARTRLFFTRSREPPQKTRTTINYALTHSDSLIMYTIIIYCFLTILNCYYFPPAIPFSNFKIHLVRNYIWKINHHIILLPPNNYTSLA